MKHAPLLISSILGVFGLGAWGAGGPAAALSHQEPQPWYREQGFVPPASGRIVACHGYGCSRRVALIVDEGLLGRARSLLASGQGSPAAERQALKAVVKAYTAYLANTIGGPPDRPRSPPRMSGQHGQMDCVDETANTTSLLLVLEEKGWLRHHQVERPQSRGLFIDGRYPHVTAVLAEKRSGLEWAVDPWKKAPGQEPEILPLEKWRQDS